MCLELTQNKSAQSDLIAFFWVKLLNESMEGRQEV